MTTASLANSNTATTKPVAVCIPAESTPVIVSNRRLTLDEKILNAKDAIKRQVVEHDRVLVACWSAGKDSSTLLNLAFAALKELNDAGQRVPPLYVVHSRTGMDNPVLDAFARAQIKQIEAYSKRIGVRAQVLVASPPLSNDYMLGILAGRTIASVGSNTKCQQMTKAYPLGQLKNKIRKHVAQQQGVKGRDARLVSLIGTRRDESADRANRMKARGESADVAVEAMAGSGELVLSAIADFETMEIFEYLSRVRKGQIPCYSDDKFEGLITLYRDMTGECMVTSYLAGTDQAKNGCSGGRSGCWTCLRVTRDASVEAMLADEKGRYHWLKPLNDFRSYLLARHYDPSARCWIGRTVDEENGTIQIMPNAYSPEFTKTMLGMLLTIQRDERIAAANLGIAPRFTILSERQLLALDFMWARYGYQKPFTAMKMYMDIEAGSRYDIPDVASLPVYSKADITFRATMPFVDSEYDAPWNGLQSLEHAVADAQSLTTARSGKLVSVVNEGPQFDIDAEGLDLFMQFELEYVFKRFADCVTNPYPSAAVHYLLSLGVVNIYKGSHGELDRILRVNNQAWRHGLQAIMHDPHAIVARLQEKFPDYAQPAKQAKPKVEGYVVEFTPEPAQQRFEFF